jgi:hypothetical protein
LPSAQPADAKVSIAVSTNNVLWRVIKMNSEWSIEEWWEITGRSDLSVWRIRRTVCWSAHLAKTTRFQAGPAMQATLAAVPVDPPGMQQAALLG